MKKIFIVSILILLFSFSIHAEQVSPPGIGFGVCHWPSTYGMARSDSTINPEKELITQELFMSEKLIRKRSLKFGKGLSVLPKELIEADKLVKKFRKYTIGYLHIDLIYTPKFVLTDGIKKRWYVFTCIGRVSKLTLVWLNDTKLNI